MNIQLLDGIDIQLLDGTTSVTPLTTSQRELLRKLEERGRAEESNRLGVIIHPNKQMIHSLYCVYD